MDSLKDLLRAHPETKAVYFNSKGDYLCYPKPGFDQMKTREEILGEEKPKPEVVIEAKMDDYRSEEVKEESQGMFDIQDTTAPSKVSQGKKKK